jgi:hypothetical protein
MTIGSLAVNIVANTSKFASGLKSAQGSLGKFVKGITGMQAAIGGLLAGGFVSMIKNTADQADALGDLSTKLGIGAEALQGFQHAAEQMGSSSDAMARSLGFMQKTLGGALGGEAGPAKAFQQLGLSIEQLRSMTPDQVFLSLVDAIRAIPNEAQQAAAAVDVFGRAGMDMLPIIRGGSAEIQKFQQQLAQNGGLIRQQDIDALGPLADKMQELGRVADALKIQFAATFGDTFKFFIDSAIWMLHQFRKAQSWIEIGMLKILGVFIDTTSELAAARKELEAMSNAPVMAPPPAAARRNSPFGGNPFGMAQMMGLPLMNMMSQAAANAKPTGFSGSGALAGMGPFAGLAMGGMNMAMMANMAAMQSQPGQRMGPLSALTGGTREAYIASRENMRPRQNDPLNKIKMNSDKQTVFQQKMVEMMAAAASNPDNVLVGLGLGG